MNNDNSNNNYGQSRNGGYNGESNNNSYTGGYTGGNYNNVHEGQIWQQGQGQGQGQIDFGQGQGQVDFGQGQYGQSQINLGQNQYEQAQGYQQGYTQEQGYTQGLPPQPPKKRKKAKRKKKHKFLKFLLFCILAYAGYKGSGNLLSNLAEKEMSQFVVDYPFTFEDESNCLWYITNDFSVPTYYELSGKMYNVEWSTSNNSITIDSSGDASVVRPSDGSVVVNVVETYKKLWGKATREYKLTVIPTSILSESDVNIISVEDLENNNYSREMQAVKDTSGNLKYMLGDFKNTYVNSSDDALVILRAYKSQFTQEDIEFEFNTVTNIGIYVTYKFDVYRNGIKYDNESASVVVSEENNKLTKISIDLMPENENNRLEDNSLAISDILNRLQEQLTSIGIDNTEDSYIVYKLDKLVSDNTIVYKASILTVDGGSYEITLNAITGDLIDYKSLVSEADEEDIRATATNEWGKEIEFNATLVKPGWLGFLKDEEYILKDQNRTIHAYNNEGWWKLLLEARKISEKEDSNFIEQIGEVFVMLGGLGDYYIEVMLKSEIKSDTNNFEDGISAQAYYNMQQVYDWYKDNLGIISFDGKGKEVVLRTHVKMFEDNAAWDNGTKTFMVNPSGDLKYSVGGYLEVMGHEYTHAVFSYAGINLSGSQEVSGLSEAYGDIMGTIIAKNSSWVVCSTQRTNGDAVVFRDLKNLNGPNLYRNLQYPEVYHGDNWTGEEHNICVLIGHVAYEMQANGGFSWDDMADIWYNSLGLCYDNSSTFVTCRKYIIQTADDLGYSDEQIDFIANAFDEREIFDESYVFRTSKYTEPEEETSDESETIKTEDNSIDGDAMLDNTASHRYLVAYSLLGSIFHGEAIFIYEEANNLSTEEQLALENRINEQIADKYDITSLSGEKIKVQYRQLSSWQLDFIDKFCSDTMRTIKGRTYDLINPDDLDSDSAEIKNIIEKIFKLAFDWEITESTAYEFYDRFGLID